MWPVTIVQLGLGAWQLAASGEDPAWGHVVARIADWAILDMDGYGRVAHLQPMPHTYRIDPPWHSAMAQGQLASLLVRAAVLLDRPELTAQAQRAARSLLDTQLGLIEPTAEGDVLQEYPATPAAHVLNGWIWALWGLYDVGREDPAAFAAFTRGCDTLAARIDSYELSNGWSRYDLYPHPVVNIASPFYHRLHIEQLRALHMLAPHAEFVRTADRWEAAYQRRATRAVAVLRKVGFRMIRPRGRRAA